jgi:hypothetical protein
MSDEFDMIKRLIEQKEKYYQNKDLHLHNAHFIFVFVPQCTERDEELNEGKQGKAKPSNINVCCLQVRMNE